MAGRGCEEEEDVEERSGEPAAYCPRPLTPFILGPHRLDRSQEEKDLHSHLPGTWADQPNNAATITHWLRKTVPAGIGGTNHIGLGQQMPGHELGILFAVGRG
jgi:hypothetical protein